MALLGVLAPWLVLGGLAPPGAHAAVGDLEPANPFAVTWDAPGTELKKLVVSPTQRDVYVVQRALPTSSGQNAVLHFRRDEAGRLTFSDCLGTTPIAACDGDPAGVNALSGINDLVVSPDGRDVYATSWFSDSLIHFRAEDDGRLRFAGCWGAAEAGCVPWMRSETPWLHAPITRPQALTISPDGRSVYVAAWSNSVVAHFRRDEREGSLRPDGCVGLRTTVCVVPPQQLGPHGVWWSHDALNNPNHIAVTPDGDSVLVTSTFNHSPSAPSSIARFARAANGTIRLADCVGHAALGCRTPAVGARGLVGAQKVVVAPNGVDVYVAAESYSDGGHPGTIARLRLRDDGTLGYLGCLAEDASHGCEPSPNGPNGLERPRSLVMSPDGASLYTGAVSSRALTHLAIRADGSPAFATCFSDVPGCVRPELGSGTGEQEVAISPDGRSVYALVDEQILVFSRRQDWSPPPPVVLQSRRGELDPAPASPPDADVRPPRGDAVAGDASPRGEAPVTGDASPRGEAPVTRQPALAVGAGGRPARITLRIRHLARRAPGTVVVRGTISQRAAGTLRWRLSRGDRRLEGRVRRQGARWHFAARARGLRLSRPLTVSVTFMPADGGSPVVVTRKAALRPPR